MEWEGSWEDPFTTYLSHFADLIGAARTRTTFGATVKGIIAAGSCVCQRIAAQSPVLASVHNGAQRIIRMVNGTSTRRSHLDAEPLTATLRTHAIAHLAAAPSDERWLIADGSELRTPYAQAMPSRMRVRALDGGLVNGYRTLTVLGVTPQRRGVLYHRLFSSKAPDFVSEPHEVQQALQTVSQAVAPLKTDRVITWILDSGFDDIAVGRTSGSRRRIASGALAPRPPAQLPGSNWAVARGQAQPSSPAPAPHGRSGNAAGGASRATEATEGAAGDGGVEGLPAAAARCDQRPRSGAGDKVEQDVWLVEVCIADTTLTPWLLLTDWKVETKASARWVFQMDRQRWAVEDRFKFTKECLGWEEVQLMEVETVRTLVA